MVVLAIGDSPGIEWEIEQVRERIGPESLLLYLPPRPTDAVTSGGRAKKEEAVYADFKPLVERYFEVEMPPFSAATYLIGFDANGQAILPVDASPGGWSFTEHDRARKAIRAQLDAILDKVHPGVRLNRHALVGRAAMWGRVAFATALTLIAVLLAFELGASGAVRGSMFGVWLNLALTALPGVAVIVGWGLLARYFRRPWVRSIPVLLTLLLFANLGLQGVQLLSGDPDLWRQWVVWHAGVTTLLQIAYGAAVLGLGIVVGYGRSPR